MRTEEEIKKIILDLASDEDRIRAVLLNGSRANSNVKPDKYQDFDIVFIVNDFGSFITNHKWTNVFGEKIISQHPQEMNFGKNDEVDLRFGFTYLMMFSDGNRIDLTIFPAKHLKTHFKIDSLTIVWLDKDNSFSKIEKSNEKDYHILKPTEKEFTDTCNEFWWVSTNVAKGLLRNEIIYAKELLEVFVRPMFMKLIEWKIGIETNFSVSSGKSGKYFDKYLEKDFYNKVLKTYSGADLETNWNSLFVMTELFEDLENYVSEQLGFTCNKEEQQNVIGYLKERYEWGRKESKI